MKIYEDSGWVLIRPSGTEKILRIFTESKDEKLQWILMKNILI
ncbi:hypothetical protein [Acidiplasma cupricumulans]|nr:hypothetical protein [Acidiplasma cupricumulans]